MKKNAHTFVLLDGCQIAVSCLSSSVVRDNALLVERMDPIKRCDLTSVMAPVETALLRVNCFVCMSAIIRDLSEGVHLPRVMRHQS